MAENPSADSSFIERQSVVPVQIVQHVSIHILKQLTKHPTTLLQHTF